MKGIVLAGGTGKRLWPITLATSKQLLPIHNKPLIYYPISTLMLANIREILLISTEQDQSLFKRLLGNGSEFGIELTYRTQEEPKGIAQAFQIGKDFIGEGDVALVLGDNLFYGSGLPEALTRHLENKGAKIFTYKVANPSDYGVLTLDVYDKPLFIEEKPVNSKSDLAVTGLYFFDNKVVNYVEEIKPSKRGELEITEIIQIYISRKDLIASELPVGTAWLDTGSPNALSDATQFVRVMEDRTGRKIACLEEIAYAKNWITEADLLRRIQYFNGSSYGSYLQSILNR
jgi:glucose-1-phosphate thymidylyltransferase